MQALSNVSILAVIIVVVLSMMIGFIWYSLPVFGKMWMQETGLKEADMKGGPGIGYLLTAVGSALMAVTMSLMIEFSQIEKIRGGLKLGLLVWLGFVATSFAANYIFAGKSLRLFLIDSGYFLATFLMAGAVITWLN